MGDPYIIPYYARLKKKLGFPLIHYVTLDGTPIPPQWNKYLSIPNIRISMTEWAKREYDKVGIPTSTIHHGVNWKWWSTTKEQKKKMKQIYGISEDTTLFISWDSNQWRKRQDALLRCWKNFHPEYKNAKLLLYTDWNCRLGWNIERLIKQYNVPRDTILSPKDITGQDKLWENAEPPEKLKEIAQMGDIYVSTTSGEGFGVCLIEAQALGMPVIAPKYSSIPEVVQSGFHIPLYRGQKGKFRWHDNCRTVEGGIVNEKAFTESLNTTYNNKELVENMGKIARSKSRMFDLFDFELNIMPQWYDLFNHIDPNVIFAQEVLST